MLHILGGLPALLLPLQGLPYWLWISCALAGLAMAYALKPTHARWLRYITKPIDRKRGVISGVRGYFAAVVALLLLWPLIEALGVVEPRRYIMFGWLALALGDGLAGLVGPGPSTGRTVPWNKQKTWWGMAGCFVGVVAAFVFSFALPLFPTGTLGGWQLWTGAVVTGGIMAAAESSELPADDNYVVGVGASLVALLLVALLLRLG